jgi:hypothetical protein
VFFVLIDFETEGVQTKQKERIEKKQQPKWSVFSLVVLEIFNWFRITEYTGDVQCDILIHASNM